MKPSNKAMRLVISCIENELANGRWIDSDPDAEIASEELEAAILRSLEVLEVNLAGRTDA